MSNLLVVQTVDVDTASVTITPLKKPQTPERKRRTPKEEARPVKTRRVTVSQGIEV